jgi:hypothetical protein
MIQESRELFFLRFNTGRLEQIPMFINHLHRFHHVIIDTFQIKVCCTIVIEKKAVLGNKALFFEKRFEKHYMN